MEKEYIVIAEEGITLSEGAELSAKDSVVSLTDEQAQPFLDSGSIALKAEQGSEAAAA